MTAIEPVRLEQADRAYYEGCLLPESLPVSRGISAALPRFIDQAAGRRATFARYRLLQGRERIDAPLPGGVHWVDPGTPEIEGCFRGVFLHGFVGEPVP